MKILRINIYLMAIVLLIAQSQLINAQSFSYKITDKVLIGGGSKWDYLSIDTVNHKLYISHGSSVNIMDMNTNKLAGEITDLKGVHGIAFSYESGKGFITNGSDNSVTVFDLKTFKVISNIKITGEKPDAISYDPYTKRIFTSNGDTNDATAIDAVTGTVVGTVKLDGAPESSVSNMKGKMFVNLEKENMINVFDPKELKVIAKWPLAPCETPTGIAMDYKNNRIFAGCRNKLMAVVNAETGKVIITLPIGSGVDACAYDPELKLVFC